MFKFKIIKDSREDGDNYGSKLVYEFEAITLSDMLEHYSNFLKGCGFVFDGELDIVTEESE